MRAHSLSRLNDSELTRGLLSVAADERSATATVVAHIAEFDARRLYLPAGYPSMHAYCVGELHLSEDAAYKRIQAARAARHFPAVLDAVAEGRLHLTGLGLLVPHLTAGNAAELLAAATHKTKSEIAELLARRFPRSEELGLVEALPASAGAQLAPAQVEAGRPRSPGQHAPAHVGGDASGQAAPGPVGPRSKVEAVAAGRFGIHLTLDRAAHDDLCYAQQLLGHAVPSGDLSTVIARALESLVKELEKRKFAATSRPRRGGRPSSNPRHVPAHVRRAVVERDGGQCTFVGETGHRCPARKRLEFDHVVEVARGGQATVEGIRLRCRGHNQYTAERTFGVGFMRHKREEAQRAAAARRAEESKRKAAETRAAEESKHRAAEARERAAAAEVITPLRLLGFTSDEARRAAALCATIPEAPLEQRLRRALSYFNARPRTLAPAATSPQGAP